MFRVSSETVKIFDVCGKRSAVNCMQVTNLTTEIAESAEIYFCSAASVLSMVAGGFKTASIVLDTLADARTLARL